MKDLCITLWNEANLDEKDLMAYLNKRVGCPSSKSWKDDLEVGLIGFAEDFAKEKGLGFWNEVAPSGQPVLYFWGETVSFPMPSSKAYFSNHAKTLK